MDFNPQLFKISIIQTKQFGPLDFELSRFHCIWKIKPILLFVLFDLNSRLSYQCLR